MIICLSGKKRVGKDVAADILVSKMGFQRIALADPIRELCSQVFDIPISVFTSDDLKEKSFNHPIILSEEYLGFIISGVEKWGFEVNKDAISGMLKLVGSELDTPRKILQTIGTEVIRNNVTSDIFLLLAQKKISSTSKNVVITDCRFRNEREFFKKLGATLCLINRPNLKTTDSHQSENELGSEDEYDVIITNDNTLSGYKIAVEEWINTKLQRVSY